MEKYPGSHMDNQPDCDPSSIDSFLRWPGGKRWLSTEIGKIIRANGCNRYLEPFLGGGAVFFKLNPDNAVLSDINNDLINTYQVIKNSPEHLVEKLKEMPVDKEYYYKIRKMEPCSSMSRAVKFLYLNRLAFNGMYRVNRLGQFNVPYGGDRKLEILWKKNLLLRASRVLSKVKLKCCDFEEVLTDCSKGDVVFCDPAYITKDSSNTFLRYNENVFTWKDQERLAECCFNAAEKGAFVIVSNACNSYINALYHPIKPITFSRYTGVSRKKTGRGKVNEALFLLNKEVILRKKIFTFPMVV